MLSFVLFVLPNFKVNYIYGADVTQVRDVVMTSSSCSYEFEMKCMGISENSVWWVSWYGKQEWFRDLGQTYCLGGRRTVLKAILNFKLSLQFLGRKCLTHWPPRRLNCCFETLFIDLILEQLPEPILTQIFVAIWCH